MTLPSKLLPGGLDRRASSPFGEGRPIVPRTPESVQNDTAVNCILVWGGALEPQSGFPDGEGRGAGRRLVSKVFSRDWLGCSAVCEEEPSEQNRDLRETCIKSLNEMEELKRVQGLHSRRKLIPDRDTILELTGKIQELQNEINCMNDSRDFQDVESVRSGNSHVTSQPVIFPTCRRSWRNAEPFQRNAEPQR